MILKPEKEELAKKIFEKWGLDFAVIGIVTDTGRVVIKMNNEIYADIPSASKPASPKSFEEELLEEPELE